MSPAELRALIGRVLVTRFPGGDGPAYRVLGFGVRDIRLVSVATGAHSTCPIDHVARHLAAGRITVRDSRRTDTPGRVKDS